MPRPRPSRHGISSAPPGTARRRVASGISTASTLVTGNDAERESARPGEGTGARGSAQNGSSGSTAIATNSSVRYVMDAWNTRIGRGSPPRTAREYRRCDS